MPSPADLNLQGDALVRLLTGVHPDVDVAARGEPDCMPAKRAVVLVRPLAGEAPAVGANGGTGGCVCETRWGAYVIADVATCGLEAAQSLVNELVSWCGEHSVPAALKPARRLPTVLQVMDGADLVKLGAAVHAVEPATSFGLTQYKTDGPANAYGAVIPVVIRYDCC